MKKTTLLLLFFPLICFAQTFEWLKTPPIVFSMNPDNIAYVTTCDASGNAYLAGYKDTPFPYNEIMGNVYFNKYDASGNAVFSKTITGHVSVSNLISDSGDNIYMLAFFVQTIAIDALQIETVLQGEQPILLKFDANGNLLWHYQPQTNGETVASCKAITIDAADQVYLGYNDYENAYIEKLSPDATSLSIITQQNGRMISSVSVDNSGNIYSAGACADWNSGYAGVLVPATTGYNIYLAKYNASGNFQWVKYVEDITCPMPQVKAVTEDMVYFSSYLFGNFAFGSLTVEGPVSGGFSDVFITRLNADGEFQWIREVPGAGYLATGNRSYLTADHDGNVYFSGRSRGDIAWDDSHMTSTTGWNNDAILLKYSSSGELLMAETAGGDSEDRYDSVMVGSNGEIFVSGMANGSASFGSFTYEAPEFSYYPFLAKMTNGTLGVVHNDAAAIGLLPNPVGDHFSISGISGNYSGSIFNLLGQKVMVFEANANTTIDVGNLSKGIYLVKVGKTQLKMLKK
jgi:hypothetical protein